MVSKPGAACDPVGWFQVTSPKSRNCYNLCIKNEEKKQIIYIWQYEHVHKTPFRRLVELVYNFKTLAYGFQPKTQSVYYSVQ